MISSVQQNRIRLSFSRSAVQYEQRAGLQARLGRDLIKRIEPGPYRTIVDIGMGTGRLTRDLKRRWPQACVVGMDFAPGMVTIAGKRYPDLRFVQADAAWLPFRPMTFDLVFSNLAYQWVDDLTQAFSRTYMILKPRGCFYLNVFTQASLKELFLAFENIRRAKDARGIAGIRRLPRIQEVTASVRRVGFEVREEHRQNLRMYFHNMLDLLRWLKGIGAQAAPRDFFVGKDMLSQAEVYYRTRFSEDRRIYVSFEVGTIVAKKF